MNATLQFLHWLVHLRGYASYSPLIAKLLVVCVIVVALNVVAFWMVLTDTEGISCPLFLTLRSNAFICKGPNAKLSDHLVTLSKCWIKSFPETPRYSLTFSGLNFCTIASTSFEVNDSILKKCSVCVCARGAEDSLSVGFFTFFSRIWLATRYSSPFSGNC